MEIDYIDMCRACMGKGDLKPLFFDYKTSCPSLLDIFIQVTGLNISKNDGLPSHICTACISLIQSASHFKEMCFQSDQTFRKGLASTVDAQTPSIKDEQDPYAISEMEPINFMGSNKENEKQQSMEELSSKNSPLAPYKCGLCTTGFAICNKLKEHVKIFHGDQLKATRLALKTKYTCSVCSKDFRTEKGYSSHYKRCDKRIKVKEEFISDSDSDTPLSVKVANRNLDSVTGLLKEDTLMDETDDKTSFDNHSELYYDNDNMDIHYNDIKVEVVDEPIIKKERKKYSCNECDLTLTKSLYNAHMESVHPTKKKSLKKKVVSRKKKMNGELGEHNEPEKLLQCSYCERKFFKESSRQLHISKHEKELNIIHKCDTCGREFKRRAHLENHLLSHAGDTGFKCDICTKAFSKQESLNVHMASHKGLKKHQCPHCDKGFNMLSTLKDHIRTHTGEKPFLCSICGRGFSQSTNLKEHMRRHQGYKPFKCSTCSQTFVSKGELEAHLRKHSGAHPFVCDECGGGFTTSSSLVKHKRIHTGERPYKCDFCNMTFTALGTMKNHRRTHTGEKPYKCQYCEKAFVQKNDLVTHTRTHTGERPYVCTVCGHAFRQSSALKTHSKIHGGSMDLMPVGVTLTRNNEQLIEINRPSLEENNSSLNVMTPKSENSNI